MCSKASAVSLYGDALNAIDKVAEAVGYGIDKDDRNEAIYRLFSLSEDYVSVTNMEDGVHTENDEHVLSLYVSIDVARSPVP